MKNISSRECRRMRMTLQTLHDAGEEPRGPVAEHVAGCAGCSAFRCMLRDLPGEIGVRQAAVRALPVPDISAVMSAAGAAKMGRAFSISDRLRRLFSGFTPIGRRLLIASAAAVPVLCAVVAAGFLFRARPPVAPGAEERLGVEAFVAELYSPSFLEDAEYGPADAALEDWLYEIAAAGSAAGSGFFGTP